MSAARLWASRVLVVVMFLWIGGFSAVVLWRSRQPMVGAREIVSPFRPWDGEWEGERMIVAATGETIVGGRVHREFHHVNAPKDFRQEGHFQTTASPNGAAEEEKELSSCDFEFKDARRKVIMKKGRVEIHLNGRIEPDGVVWSRSIPGAIEIFREWVEGGTSYELGAGIYTDGARVFPVTIVGRYIKTSKLESAPAPANPENRAAKP